MSGGRNYIPKRVELSDVTLEGEIWKNVIGYEGLYLVSNLGRMYSVKPKHLLKIYVNVLNGYCQIPLSKDKTRKSYRVHRLVAQAFIPNPFNKKEVNHINKNITDNTVENLEWNTGTENIRHRFGHSTWNNRQGRIAPSMHSKRRRELEEFSNVVIPMIHKLVPLN
jgi:hypothetical protein